MTTSSWLLTVASFFGFFTQAALLFDFCTQDCIFFGFFTRLASLITLWYPLFHTLVSCLPHSTLWYPLFHTLVSYLFNFGILSSTLWYPPAGIAFWLLHAGFAFFFGFFTQAASLFGCVTRRHRFLAFAQACIAFWLFHHACIVCIHTLVSPLPHFGIPSSTLWYPLFHFGIPRLAGPFMGRHCTASTASNEIS